ncbi:MAG: hypothetical protein Pg6C_00800 [Treponemataceae bacterium]|nr:MAG: hypothetical protein Pg6C_00800 [Treponemataceae bacterium]
MVIAIDGPAGSGKSTAAKLIALKLGIVFLNSGSFYRGITLIAQRRGVVSRRASARAAFTPEQEAGLAALARGLSIDYKDSRLVIDGEDVEDLLHSDAVDADVSLVSAITPLRHIVNAHIRRLTGRSGQGVGSSGLSAPAGNCPLPPAPCPLSIVCEGRDMTTVVFPDADYKFYLDASIDVQAERRFKQGVSALSLDEIKEAIRVRDENDKKKAEGALKIASDAYYIDTSDLTIDKVCDIILGKIFIPRVTYG